MDNKGINKISQKKKESIKKIFTTNFNVLPKGSLGSILFFYPSILKYLKHFKNKDRFVNLVWKKYEINDVHQIIKSLKIYKVNYSLKEIIFFKKTDYEFDQSLAIFSSNNANNLDYKINKIKGSRIFVDTDNTFASFLYDRIESEFDNMRIYDITFNEKALKTDLPDKILNAF